MVAGQIAQEPAERRRFVPLHVHLDDVEPRQLAEHVVQAFGLDEIAALHRTLHVGEMRVREPAQRAHGAPVGGAKRQHLDVREPVHRNAAVEQLHVARIRLDGHDEPVGPGERRREEGDDPDVRADVDDDVAGTDGGAHRRPHVLFVFLLVEDVRAEVGVVAVDDDLIAAEVNGAAVVGDLPARCVRDTPPIRRRCE